MSQLDKLLTRLEGVKSTGQGKYLTRCPAHADKSPSLAIKHIDGDRLLIHCFSGCPTESVLAAVGLTFADLFPEKTDPRHPKTKPPKFYKSELFEPLLNAAMVLLIGTNTAAGNPLQKPAFFKQPLTEADFVRMVQAMNVIENIFMETKTK